MELGFRVEGAAACAGWFIDTFERIMIGAILLLHWRGLGHYWAA